MIRWTGLAQKYLNDANDGLLDAEVSTFFFSFITLKPSVE